MFLLQGGRFFFPRLYIELHRVHDQGQTRMVKQAMQFKISGFFLIFLYQFFYIKKSNNSKAEIFTTVYYV